MLIPLLNVMNSDVKLPQNTILGSINKVDNVENVQSSYSLKHHNVKANAQSHPSKPLLPAFQIAPASQHMHMTVINHQLSYKMQMSQLEIRHKFNTMLFNKFAEIFSKSPTDFGQTNLIEMDLPTTGPPVSTKLYIITLKYKCARAQLIS